MTLKKIVPMFLILLLISMAALFWTGCTPSEDNDTKDSEKRSGNESEEDPKLEKEGKSDTNETRIYKASVTGTIYLDGRPVTDYTVQLVMDDQVAANGSCNSQGRFIIKDLLPGEYIVRVLDPSGATHGGYKSVVILREGRTESITIELTG